MVTATVTGKRELKSVVIDPDAVDPDDVEMLQDMIVAAINQALSAVENDEGDPHLIILEDSLPAGYTLC